MNKLLQYLMSKPSVEHKLLPGLQKMQMAGSVQKANANPLFRFTNNSQNVNDNIPNSASLRSKAEIDLQMRKAKAAQIEASESAKRYGVLRPAPAPRSMASKAWAIATNPMTALAYKVQGRDIPDNFELGEKNSLDFAVNMVNPFAIANAVASIPGNIKRGELLDAGLNALNIIPVAAGAKTIGRVAKATTPALRRAAQTAGTQLTRLSKTPSLPVQSSNIEELRRIYHNAERILQPEESRILRLQGHGDPLVYRAAETPSIPRKYSAADFKASGWGTDRWNLENHVNSIFGPPSNYKPPIINRSGLTKEELISKAAAKDKDLVSKMSEKDFQETVFKPTGEISPYYDGSVDTQFTGSNAIFDMSPQEYAETFNSRLDLLNDIINRNNKSGFQYNVEKLTPEGKLYFNTPKQFVPRNLTDTQKAKFAEFESNPEEFINKYVGLNKLDDGSWRFNPDAELGTYATKEDAITDFTNRIKKEFAPKEISGKTDWNVRISPGQWRGTVQDVANADYYKRIPGLSMAGTTDGVFADNIARRGTGAYKSINEYLKALDLGRVKPGFNSQTNYSRGLWEDAVKKGNAFGYYNNNLNTVYGSMKSVLPYAIPAGIGAGALTQQKYGGQPCYECGGSIKKYAIGGLYDCPDQEKDPETGKCKAEVVRGREAAAANKAASADMNAWAKQVAAMDKENARQNAAQTAGQLTFDYDWMQSPVDKADKKAAMAQYKQFFQQNPNVFVPDDTSGYSPEQKYIIASKLKQRLSTPMGAQLAQKKLGVDPRYYDLQRMQSELAPKMGGWNGMRDFLFNVYKEQGGEYNLPQAQWGQMITPVDMGIMASKFMKFFGLDKPNIVRTPASAPKRLSIRDPRKIMMTTGQPLRPNSDLVSGEYDSEHLGNLLTEAKRRKMSYNDMMNLAAMGFQETKWGRSDDNIGHTMDEFGAEPEQDSYSNFIDAYNAKMKDADRLKIKDEATRLQVYNGLGKIFPSTEARYHGFNMKKIYGVPVPKGGIDLRKNPLYGKQVIDIRDNVLKRNPEFMRYMDSTYRAPMPKEEFANGGPIIDPQDYIKQQYNEGLDFHTKWLNSPMYKSMINASDPVNAKQITDQRKKRLSAVRFSYSSKPSNQTGADADILGNIKVYPLGLKHNIGTHEISHVTDTGPGLDLIPAKDQISILEKAYDKVNLPKYNANKKYVDYINQPTETRARLNHIRQEAYKNKLYDPFTQKVNPAIYNKLKNFKFDNSKVWSPLEQLRLAYTDEQILQMLNSVSKTQGQDLPQAKGGGPILDPRGQWAHPGKVTRIPSSNITMQGVPYPVLGVGSNGQQQIMQPGRNYNFGGASYVDEYPMMQGGGTAYVDSVLNANRNLDWVKRLYQKNGPSLQIPGLKGPSTHYMESGDGRVYPTVAMVNNKLTYLPAAGIDPFDYADSTKTYIKFPTDKEATWFGKNYKQGTGVLPKNASGGQHGGLDRWFAEKWVDVKTGKACGRQEGEKRAGYPACRPSRRVSSETPKTSSEMSPAEKAKFKASKTSSQRINYNHKRNK